MMSKFTKSAAFILLTTLFFSCQPDAIELPIDLPINLLCGDKNLEIISDGEDCDIEPFFLICDAVTVEEVNCLYTDDFKWIPLLSKDIGDEIKFKNKNGGSFTITISNKNHFIHETRTYTSCIKSIEHVTYICQKNETAIIEFTSPIFEDDTTRFRLFKQISEYKDGEFGDQTLLYTLGQPRTGSNVHNFYHYVYVNNEYDNRAQVYHEEIILNDKIFTEVFEHKIRETYHSEPHMSIYINKKYGIFGFKKDGVYWLQE